MHKHSQSQPPPSIPPSSSSLPTPFSEVLPEPLIDSNKLFDSTLHQLKHDGSDDCAVSKKIEGKKNYYYEDDYIDEENWKLTEEERKLVIPLQSLYNFRDLSITSKGRMKERMIYRAANLCGANADDATFIISSLGIKTMIDMRRECERGRNKTGLLLGGFHRYFFRNCQRKIEKLHQKFLASLLPDLIHHSHLHPHPSVDQSLSENHGDQSIITYKKKHHHHDVNDHAINLEEKHKHKYKNHITAGELEYHHIPLTSFRFSFEVFKSASINSIAKAGIEMVKGDAKEMVKQITSSTFSKIDLADLYKRYLLHSSPAILHVMKQMLREDRYPIVFYCTAGKDRTGIIAMFIQAICGVDEKTIIADYHLSEKFLFPILNSIKRQFHDDGIEKEEFSYTPIETIVELIKFINTHYGSIQQYLDSIGFTLQDQAKLRSILLK